MGTQELIIIAVILLVLFGGSQVPKLARNLGKAQKEFKDGLSEADREAQQRKLDEQRAADGQRGATAIDAPADRPVERTDAPPPAT